MSNCNKLQDIAYLRREYTRGGLSSKDLPSNPLVLFNTWLQQACAAQLPDPTAMTVATVNNNGQPYQRTVLLKQYDENGMVFYTNLGSRKSLQLLNNPKVSLHFFWHLLERQVMLLGKVEKLSSLEVLKYFHSRPYESQVGAWVSKQSTNIPTRKILEKRFFEFKKKFQPGKVPLPDFWGGFRVKYYTIEFWQGGEYRLHDRFIYQIKNNNWMINRLSP
ncbi:pyridoxamine 5'-phosphate oxidase [Pantoea sp. Aalb]|uniref:pyridoxamine 5'-phosphate oxidase n=1 Tax=Pantoea sp. Aalb TaxID=2576762 RepID=UPI001322EC23|nr:pyridoxamine 5'-phosphate oxidase [Pantoea sp. Aalb]MXP67417.1 pyridoxamine 5'-phosphate oxidase [Pantoea sp. Aalb]